MARAWKIYESMWASTYNHPDFGSIGGLSAVRWSGIAGIFITSCFFPQKIHFVLIHAYSCLFVRIRSSKKLPVLVQNHWYRKCLHFIWFIWKLNVDSFFFNFQSSQFKVIFWTLLMIQELKSKKFRPSAQLPSSPKIPCAIKKKHFLINNFMLICAYSFLFELIRAFVTWSTSRFFVLVRDTE